MLCQGQPLLPIGLTDVPYEKSVKLYCGRCEDIYSPKSSRHGSIDGAYFGTSFPHLLFLVYPSLLPPKSGPTDAARASGAVGLVPGAGATVDDPRRRGRPREELVEGSDALGDAINTAAVALRAERYRPRIFGFQVNEVAKLQRWQEAVRDRCVVLFARDAKTRLDLGPTQKTGRAAGSARGPVALVLTNLLRHCVYSSRFRSVLRTPQFFVYCMHYPFSFIMHGLIWWHRQ